jgi:hypothetical protein
MPVTTVACEKAATEKRFSKAIESKLIKKLIRFFC